MKKIRIISFCVSAFLLFSFITVISSGLTLRSAEVIVLAGLCAFASASDMICLRIPDRLILTGILFRLCRIFYDHPRTAFPALCVSFLTAVMITIPVFVLVLIMDRICKKETMGGGDLKLIFLMSLFFPVRTALYGLLSACILGILTIPVFLLGKTRQKGYPFGPALAAGFFLSFLLLP